MIHIIGGGLIGLATAFELRSRGHDVRVYERSIAARAASWAGAGMLAPYTEDVHDTAFAALCGRSLLAYPAFVERVRAAGGVDPRLNLDGIVHAAFDDASMALLIERSHELFARGIAATVLDRRSALALEPSLGNHVCGALLVQGEGCVDNRRLGRALAAACRATGVELIEECGTLAVECDERRVLGIRTALGFTPANCIVNAAGAWADGVEGIPPRALPGVFPVKGQMLALAVPAGFVRRTIWVPGAYFVPRDDGRVLVGATVERTGFDERVTAAGVNALLSAALRAMPALSDFTVTETWAGLRPGTPDGLPRIGASPIEGLYHATGHFRNGILLAPVTAAMVADAIEQTEALAGL